MLFLNLKSILTNLISVYPIYLKLSIIPVLKECSDHNLLNNKNKKSNLSFKHKKTLLNKLKSNKNNITINYNKIVKKI